MIAVMLASRVLSGSVALWVGAVVLTIFIGPFLTVFATNWTKTKRMLRALFCAAVLSVIVTKPLIVISCGYCCDYLPKWLCGEI